MNIIETQELQNYSVHALDGVIGKINDFYFDEKLFYLRYFLVDSSSFLQRKFVLISPISFKRIDSNEKNIYIHMTKKEIENTPTLSSSKIFSREYEKIYNDYFSWPYYWGSRTSAWALGPYGISMGDSNHFENLDQKNEKELRLASKINSFSIKSGKDNFGHIKEFILNEKSLAIDFLVIDTVNYFPSKLVILRPEWIEKISWNKKEIRFPFSKDQIRSAPAYIKGSLNQSLVEMTDKYFIEMISENINKLHHLINDEDFKIKNSRSKINNFIHDKDDSGHMHVSIYENINKLPINDMKVI